MGLITYRYPTIRSRFSSDEIKRVKLAFIYLMGKSGEKFVDEILTTGSLSQKSYDTVKEATSRNTEESITNHFGVVHWYYLQGK